MHRILVPLFCLGATHVLAANPGTSERTDLEPFRVGQAISVLTTVDGTSLKGVKILQIEPDSVVVSYDDGMARVSLDKLSTELQQRFGYNKQAATAYRQEKEAAAQKAYEQRSQAPAANASLRENPAFQSALAAANENGKKNGETRRQIDQEGKRALEELHSNRIAEENAAAVRLAEANERTKTRFEERKKEEKKKKR